MQPDDLISHKISLLTSLKFSFYLYNLFILRSILILSLQLHFTFLQMPHLPTFKCISCPPPHVYHKLYMGPVKAEQGPIKTVWGATHWTLSSKGTPFQDGTDEWSHLWKVPRSRWISYTCPIWLWGFSSSKISPPGIVFHGTRWLLWRPHM
jgi:hypothetical protein